jgi:acyl-CoA thioesterase-1
MRLFLVVVVWSISFGSNFAAASEPLRVACIGDSITAGVGTVDPVHESYPAQLSSLLGGAYCVRNFGHSGATLCTRTNLPYWSQPEFTAAKEFKPNIVVLMLGTNDARPETWKVVKNEFVPTLKQQVAALRSLPSNPKVYICVPVPAFEERQSNVENAVVPLVRQAARETGAPIIDLFRPLSGHSELFPDRLHPSAVGAEIMAAVVCHSISDAAARKKQWKIESVDSEEPDEGFARFAIDGRADTYWHTAYRNSTPRHPHSIVIDLGGNVRMFGLTCMAREIGVNGRVRDYEVLAGGDAFDHGAQVATGRFGDAGDEEFVFFKLPVIARYITFRALSEINGGPWTSMAELDVLGSAEAATRQRASEGPSVSKRVDK